MAIKKDTTTEIHRWTQVVSDASLTFHRRWTELALRRIDPGLARLLHEQVRFFDEACLTGEVDEIGVQGAATARGYAAAVRAMGAANVPDDSYQMGSDPVTGCKVAIGSHKGIIDRVVELHGQDVMCVTPDEVAVMIGAVEAIKGIGEIKRLFPGAEIVRRYEMEGT